MAGRWCDRCKGARHEWGERCPAVTYTYPAVTTDPTLGHTLRAPAVDPLTLPPEPCTTCQAPAYTTLCDGYVVTICTACDLNVPVQ